MYFCFLHVQLTYMVAILSLSCGIVKPYFANFFYFFEQFIVILAKNMKCAKKIIAEQIDFLRSATILCLFT